MSVCVYDYIKIYGAKLPDIQKSQNVASTKLNKNMCWVLS